jgi:hypothetical protein
LLKDRYSVLLISRGNHDLRHMIHEHNNNKKQTNK